MAGAKHNFDVWVGLSILGVIGSKLTLFFSEALARWKSYCFRTVAPLHKSTSYRGEPQMIA